MADRFCGNCGSKLSDEDRFCRNCGRPVDETAHVPTPEADVPTPPPPASGHPVPRSGSSAASAGHAWWITRPGPYQAVLVPELPEHRVRRYPDRGRAVSPRQPHILVCRLCRSRYAVINSPNCLEWRCSEVRTAPVLYPAHP
jgi:hypothetical protein